MTKQRHAAALEKAKQAVEANRARCAEAPWRPVYHIAAPCGWINDPNGFCYYDGAYHLFYQYHPYSAGWGPMHWGHVRSKDLTEWEECPIALAPGEAYDVDGCFSGSALEKDGKLYVMYTGHVDLPVKGPGACDRVESQCLAVSADGLRFEKLAANPVIAKPPEGDIHPGHFRDPKIWRMGGKYYCVVGSRTKDEHGQALLFASDDIKRWEFVNVMASGDGDVGFMWECPSFERAGETDILICSPQGMRPRGKQYLNLHQSGYMLGKLDEERGVFSHGPFALLDYGFDFYAPQTMTDPNGRILMIGWMDMWESEMPEQADGWAGVMSTPRELAVRDGKLLSTPARELRRLRGARVSHANVAISAPRSLAGIQGDCFELEAVFDLQDAKSLTLKCRVSDREETVMVYDRSSQTLKLNRDRAGKGPKGEREAPATLKDGCVKLHLFADRSSLEIFINDGEAVMSARVYPQTDAIGVEFSADGTAMLKSAEFYTLG